MTSIIKLEALSGVQDDGPLCYLLQVDEFHFLLDCGWDETFDLEYVETLRRRVPQIDAVLLSYADIPHIGALPYVVGKCGLSCPIYATVPTYKMGQMFLYDWYLSHTNVEDFNHFSLDDIDAAFDKVQQLKYSQQVLLKGRGHGLQITPIPAGHMIGGSIWKITKMGEEEIVYSVDFNHKRDRHLNGCSIPESIGRASLLITDSYSSTYTQTRRKQRDEELLTNILGTLRNGGDCLIAIDTAGRVLELAHLLDQLWHNADAGLITYSLVMMSNVAYNVVEFAKSQVEWMSQKIVDSFNEGRKNPFQFGHVQLAHNILELNRVRSPKVVLASMPDMESGFARELFLEWCADSKNSIIVTSRSGARTLGSKLIHIATGGPDVSRHLTLEIKRRIRLEGHELDDFWRKKKEKEHQEARQRMEMQKRTSRIETVESSDESDVEDMDTANPSDHPYDIMYKFEQQQKSSFFKQSKKTYAMYPFAEEKVQWDDYGQVIRPEDYMLAEPLVPANRITDFKRDREGLDSDNPDVALLGASEIPSKCISSVTKLEVLCRVAFIDFEGRSDGDSVKRLIEKIKPKQLIIVHGSSEATRDLRGFCEKHTVAPGRIFTPRLGEVVDATIESHIYQVTLTDLLMSQIEFQPINDAELSWIDARINYEIKRESDWEKKAGATQGSLALPSTSKQAEDEDQEGAPGGRMGPEPESAAVPSLENLPANAIPSHVAVFVNDPKLSDLKHLLTLSGFQPEFSGGVLYVNNVISIKRNEAGNFNIEGVASEEYYRIRDLIYKQFAIV